MRNKINGSAVYAGNPSIRGVAVSIDKQIQICRIAAEQIGSVVAQVVIKRKKRTIDRLI